MNGVQVFGTNKGLVVLRVSDGDGAIVIAFEPRAAIELARDLVECANHAQTNASLPPEKPEEEKKETSS